MVCSVERLYLLIVQPSAVLLLTGIFDMARMPLRIAPQEAVDWVDQDWEGVLPTPKAECLTPGDAG